MSGKIVFDIETKNNLNDVGRNVEALEVSVVGVYSYENDEYKIYDENELEELGKVLQKASPLIGFSSKRFDVPVLEKHCNFKLSAVPHFDIFEEIYGRLGRRIGLGLLAEANVGEGKTGHGLDAIKMYERGEMEELKKYCLQDVRVTKMVFDLIVKQGYLWVPKRNLPEMEKVEISYNEPETEQKPLM